MAQLPDTQQWSPRFDQFDRDIQLKRALDVLEKENGELRQLVVRLSETIIRNVTANVASPSLYSPRLATEEDTRAAGGSTTRISAKARRQRRT